MKRHKHPAAAAIYALRKEYGNLPGEFTAREFTLLYNLLALRETAVSNIGNVLSVVNEKFGIKYSIARIKEIDENKRLLHETVAVEVRRVVKGVTFVDNITAFWDHNATYNGGMQRVIRTHTASGPEYSIFISCPNEDNQYEVSKIPIHGAEIQLFDILETTFPQLLFVRDPKKVAEEFRKILYSKLKERF
ncbi:MAG: hypothetical protein QY312_00035 [Candidatus Dojkabacteria bacterium]|nr:MAG: hypothetical protein QY312_00035 [Candidatus Dojkabacteria bacterium]